MGSVYDIKLFADCPASLLCYTDTLVHFIDCSMCGKATGVLFGNPRPAQDDVVSVVETTAVTEALLTCFSRYITFNDWTLTPNVGWRGTQMCPQCLSMYGSENRYLSW